MKTVPEGFELNVGDVLSCTPEIQEHLSKTQAPSIPPLCTPLVIIGFWADIHTPRVEIQWEEEYAGPILMARPYSVTYTATLWWGRAERAHPAYWDHFREVTHGPV